MEQFRNELEALFIKSMRSLVGKEDRELEQAALISVISDHPKYIPCWNENDSLVDKAKLVAALAVGIMAGMQMYEQMFADVIKARTN